MRMRHHAWELMRHHAMELLPEAARHQGHHLVSLTDLRWSGMAVAATSNHRFHIRNCPGI